MVDAGLTDEEIYSIRKLAFAQERFEPYATALIAQPTLDSLVSAGLAECGASCRPAVGPAGYRLTEKGWRLAHQLWTWTKPTALMRAEPLIALPTA